MSNESDGLSRDVKAGETVILATGANATLRRAYPKGYAGDVEIVLDGNPEVERVDGLTLTNAPQRIEPAQLGDAEAAQDVAMGETRAPSRKMEH